jgi:hypothetical protein
VSPRSFALLCAAVLVVGCGARGAPRAATPAAPERSDGGTTTRLPEIRISAAERRDVTALLERAERAFAAEAWEDAARDFDRALALDPDGPDARVRFRAGWAHDNAGHHEAALRAYEDVARRIPDDPLAREALVRTLRLLCHLEQWDRAGEVADVVLSRYGDLRAVERIVAHGAKALSLVASSEPEAAAPHVARARADIERLQLDRQSVIHRDVAQLFYALGELRRLRAERIAFNPLPPDFLGALERRCRLLLDAQSAYADAMRAQDSHWSAMAGVRIGQLYQDLHRDLLDVPRPPAASESAERAALFDGAMRLRYAVLLRKGLAMMDHTVAMADRLGETSEWIARARAAQVALERELELEEDAVAALPYTRQELTAALDALRRRGEGAELSGRDRGKGDGAGPPHERTNN